MIEPVAWMVTNEDGQDAYVTADPTLAKAGQRAHARAAVACRVDGYLLRHARPLRRPDGGHDGRLARERGRAAGDRALVERNYGMTEQQMAEQTRKDVAALMACDVRFAGSD